MFKLLMLLTVLFLFIGCTPPAGDSAPGSSNSSSSSGGTAGSGLLAGGSGSSGGGSSGDGSSPNNPTIPTHHNPEPATLALFGVGLGGLAIAKTIGKFRKKR